MYLEKISNKSEIEKTDKITIVKSLGKVDSLQGDKSSILCYTLIKVLFNSNSQLSHIGSK